MLSCSQRENSKSGVKKKKIPEDPERLSRTVFVGNVPLTVDRKVISHNEVLAFLIKYSTLSISVEASLNDYYSYCFHQDA